MGSILKSSSGAFVAQVNIGGKRRSKSFETKVLAQRARSAKKQPPPMQASAGGPDVALLHCFMEERRAMGAGPSTIGQDMTYIGTIMRSTGPVEGVPVAAALKALTAARKAMTASGAISRSQERTRGPTGKEQITLRDFWAKRRRGIPIWTLTTFAIATAIRLSEITGLRWRAIIIRER